MKGRMMPQIHKRVITTSIAIILGFSVAFGLILNQLYVQSYIAMYSADLVTAVPQIMSELRRDDLIRMGKEPHTRPTYPQARHSNYLAFLCKPENKVAWMSYDARNKGMEGICAAVPQKIAEPDLIYYRDQPYVIHVISDATYSDDALFFVAREVTPQLERLTVTKRKTWLYVFLLFLTATGLLYAASYWSFGPLRKLADQLNEIAESRRDKLDQDYPKELEDVTDALNRMITLREEQTKRYRHAMDDLAHSLKSRLAATNALLDDPTLNRDAMSKRIVEQVSQMDDMVQYQLKRALVGQRGLVRVKTALEPVVDSLNGMFGKIYSDKPVTITKRLHTDSLPLNKDDLTDLLGNLLENAYRFSISEILLTSRDTAQAFILTVEDDGPGVADKYRESIFQRGVRADQLNPGTGIGLAVCSEIVAGYGGSISVSDSRLQGAAFVMTFPKR